MWDRDQNANHPPDLETNEKDPKKVSGLGSLLRTEREKKGLSYEQVARITRLRQNVLEALEDEDWHKLPPPVFVKGFIKTYSEILGLDEKELLGLYETIFPAAPAPLKPLSEPTKNTKRNLFFLVLVACAIAVMVYLWKGYSSRPPKPLGQKEKVQKAESKETSDEKPPPPTPKSKEPGAVREQGLSATTSFLDGELGHGEKSHELSAGDAPDPILLDDYLFVDTTGVTIVPTEWLVLEGMVKSRTWIRIHIDDQQPKEYIFHPGSRIHWKARHGFNVLIGNAAGIEFEFNGKKIENLGDMGQIVRLRLPEGYVGEDSED